MNIAILLVVLAMAWPTHEQDTPLSPCPNVFMYEPLGNEPGRWYGVVTLSTDSTLHSLWLNIVLDSKADILGNWVGDVSTEDNIDFKIENTKMKIQPGPALAVRFFIQYNPLNKTPRLQTIRLNGREICNANNRLPAIDIPITKPVRPMKPTIDTIVTERPFDDNIRPVYVRPSDPAYPTSINGGENPAQTIDQNVRPNNNRLSTTTVRSTTRRRTTTTESDYNNGDDNNGVTEKLQYFTGGPLTITLPGPTNNNYYNNNNKEEDVCGTVVFNNALTLIVNGTPTTEGQWPWQIALYQTQIVDNKYICGGTLVSHRHVITAAHCVTYHSSKKVVNQNTLTVYLGKHNLKTSVDGVEIRFVKRIIVHPEYNATSYSQDIAILELREPVNYSSWIRPACLWPEDQVDLSYVVGKKGSVVGWGFDETGVPSEELTLVEMPIVKPDTCIRSYSEFFVKFTNDQTYCAGYRDGTSVCNGDSGGGMVFKLGSRWYIRGLVSLAVARHNELRCDPTHYVIFTDVAKHLSWIKGIISE